MRADAYDSSKLHEDSRWGYFPSIAAGWTISNEEFFSGVSRSIISNLKLRASYGINGNVNILSGYPYASTLSLSGYYPFSADGSNNVNGAVPSTRLINPDLHWETTNHLDIGIDARFLNDRMSLTMDYFDKNTSGMLLSSIPPASSGATSVYLNAGMVNNHGFEFELGWQDRVGKDFTYSINGNAATLSNIVTELKEVDFIKGSGNVSQTYTYFEEGHDIWYFRAYKLIGIDQTNGAAIYEDVNNDEQITEEDRVNVGSGIPKLTYGGTINLSYKGFDASILGSGVAGFSVFSAIFLPDRPGSNRYEYFLEDAWLPTNTPEENLTKRYPKPNQGDDKILISDAMLNKGDFFKIKQLQIGYTVPVSILRKIEVSSFRVYVSLEDFFTFTKYPGIDPEIVSAGGGSSMGLDRVSYPISKKFTLGVNLTF
jgi:TonB-linked SusC/RagA family outer membrane protein